MQIAQATTNPNGIAPGNASNAAALDGTALGLAGEHAATATPVTPTPTTAAPLQRGLSNWDAPLQGDIASAQQALDYLEQSASQLRSLKAELSAKLASAQQRDGTVEARVRQFSTTWKQRQQSSGGTLNSSLQFSTAPARQTFTVRGMTLGNLRVGARETLAISTGGGSQSLRSVTLQPGMSDADIVQAFNTALAPSDISVAADNTGTLQFSTPESAWTTVRDNIAVQGGGIRFPAGQLNRVKADPAAPAIDPDSWQTSDTDALRATLQQVMQALAQVEQAQAQVSTALAAASARVDDTQAASAADNSGSMTQVAANFVTSTNQPGYQSLLSLSSALVGISRERVVSLLSLG